MVIKYLRLNISISFFVIFYIVEIFLFLKNNVILGKYYH